MPHTYKHTHTRCVNTFRQRARKSPFNWLSMSINMVVSRTTTLIYYTLMHLSNAFRRGGTLNIYTYVLVYMLCIVVWMRSMHNFRAEVAVRLYFPYRSGYHRDAIGIFVYTSYIWNISRHYSLCLRYLSHARFGFYRYQIYMSRNTKPKPQPSLRKRNIIADYNIPPNPKRSVQVKFPAHESSSSSFAENFTWLCTICIKYRVTQRTMCDGT